MAKVKTMIALFTEKDDAEGTIKELEKNGYSPKNVSLIMKDDKKASQMAKETGAGVGEGAASGAATGAAVGGITGLLIGLGAITIPGIGAVLIGGPLAAALGLTGAAATTATGAMTGAVAGGLIGALMGLGLTRNEAEHYERRIEEGAILLAIPAYSGQENEVESILSRYNATDIRSLDVATTATLEDTSEEKHEKKTSGFWHPTESGHVREYDEEQKDEDHIHANPVQVQKYLKHVDYPASKHQLVREAKEEGADSKVVHTLDELPDEQKFKNPTSVSEALGNLHH